MDLQKDFGDGFVRLSKKPLCPEECIGLLVEHHRAIQLPDGDIFLLGGDDSAAALIIDDAEAENYGIHAMDGTGDLLLVSACPNADCDRLMEFIKSQIIRFAGKTRSNR